MNFHHTKEMVGEFCCNSFNGFFFGENGSKVTILLESSPWLSSFCSVAALLTVIVALGKV